MVQNIFQAIFFVALQNPDPNPDPDPDPQAPAGQAVQNPDPQVITPQAAGQVQVVRASFPSYLLL